MSKKRAKITVIITIAAVITALLILYILYYVFGEKKSLIFIIMIPLKYKELIL